MRENIGLYRGKREDNGEWVEGYYFERKDAQGNIIESIIIVDAYEQITGGQKYLRSNLGYESFRVDPKTIGECSGLPDKNGKRIFEGDILDTTNSNSRIWYVDYKKTACCCNQGNANYSCELDDFMRYSDVEVIGSIHDNLELLEVENT